MPVTLNTLPWIDINERSGTGREMGDLDSYIAEVAVDAIALREELLGDGIALRRVQLDWFFGLKSSCHGDLQSDVIAVNMG